jgi:hypothetical protein
MPISLLLQHPYFASGIPHLGSPVLDAGPNDFFSPQLSESRRIDLHGLVSLRLLQPESSVLRMKNLKSLQVVALAGVVVALTAGCSSTSSGRADYNSSDPNAAYRYVSAGGWVPITDITKMAAFPQGWTPGEFGPVSYETYTFAPPVADQAMGSAAVTTSASSSSTTIATDGSHTTVSTQPGSTTTIASDGSSTTITSNSPQFSENMQPGDTFVEAAGANSDGGKVRRVILYSPFGTAGVGN